MGCGSSTGAAAAAASVAPAQSTVAAAPPAPVSVAVAHPGPAGLGGKTPSPVPPIQPGAFHVFLTHGARNIGPDPESLCFLLFFDIH